MRKRTFLFPIIGIVLLLSLFSQKSTAQIYSPVPGNFGSYQTQPFFPFFPPVNRVGIGLFSNANPPLSVLTVNGASVPNIPTGEVFRTQGPLNQNTHWRMFRGQGQEIGNIFNLSTDFDFRIRAAQDGADIVFQSEFNNISPFTGTERMRIGHGRVNPIPPNPNTVPGGIEVTRVTINEDPTNPIRTPLSLLHIGFSGAGPSFREEVIAVGWMWEPTPQRLVTICMWG